MEASVPQNITQLKSFLGMLNYYSKFLPNLSTLVAPLYKLSHKKTSWQWSKAQQEVFCKAKELLVSSPVLVHIDPAKPQGLSGDASPYGIGAFLSQKLADGTEHPVCLEITFTSRTELHSTR